ncbi:phenylalanine--tRNA ligase subunit alpha, partial [candidate division WOR-3 bacterium]|nr:phenylalanine--tRNA ligase subunit alpha [candidate division WOR-3 bacterium]
MKRLPEHEHKLLAALAGGPRPVESLVEETGLDQSLVMAAATGLRERGLVAIDEREHEELSVTDAGQAAARAGFPERAALGLIVERGGAVAFQELAKLLGKDDFRAEVKWLTRKNWCGREAGTLVVTDSGRAALVSTGPDEELLSRLAETGPLAADAVEGIDVAAALELLAGRGEYLKRKKRVSRTVGLTDAGRALVAAGIEPAEEVTQLTPELLVSGEWRNVVFKPYDPKLDTAELWPGKPHPLGRVIQETRRTFLEMGFEEVESPAIETEFWDFDALFQPQDHPARELQDTFFLAEPSAGRLPDEKLVGRVAQTHEDGGETGSTGWRYRWEREKARRLVMRTHTTAATIRALAQDPRPPRKVFCIGKCFRRDDIDQTHLPEFTQIDGIIIDEEANLATLFGTLREFYLKMGAKEVRFRPSFFPYTEPSAEV